MNAVVTLVPNKLQEISLAQTIKSFLLDCQLKNLSPGTVRWYEGKIKDLVHFLQNETSTESLTISHLTEENIKAFLRYEMGRKNLRCEESPLSSYTLRGTVVSLKVFLKFLQEENYLKENLAAKLKTPRVKKKIIETLSQEHIQSLLSAPDKEEFHGFRDYCMLLTFLDTGIRLSELISLKARDVDFSTNMLFVLGKGDKERRVPFGMNLRKALEKYLAWRAKVPQNGTLFVNVFGEKMKSRCIQDMLLRYGKRAGITGVRMSPHTLRHTFAKMSLLNGMDAITLQYILGHTTLDMVRNYVNLTSQDVALNKNRFSLMDRMGIDGTMPRKKLW